MDIKNDWERRLWIKVYCAAIRAGFGPASAADAAVVAFRERNGD